jgi:hypothetical protein
MTEREIEEKIKIKQCDYCDKEFKPFRTSQWFCSAECEIAAMNSWHVAPLPN